MSRAWLALGSNLGDRAGYLRRAREALEGGGVRILRTSSIEETDPVGVVDQPRFLNQVLEVETDLDPNPLLDMLKAVERRLGRSPGPRWGPREIDIDILTYEDRVVDEPGLQIPHPELERRPFLKKLLEEARTARSLS
jgi:2-amino-4-hydroxy-6-hydroxymethyldihydropteridine diphosphokinase